MKRGREPETSNAYKVCATPESITRIWLSNSYPVTANTPRHRQVVKTTVWSHRCNGRTDATGATSKPPACDIMKTFSAQHGFSTQRKYPRLESPGQTPAPSTSQADHLQAASPPNFFFECSGNNGQSQGSGRHIIKILFHTWQCFLGCLSNIVSKTS